MAVEFRDATLFKTAYAFGLRHNETGSWTWPISEATRAARSSVRTASWTYASGRSKKITAKRRSGLGVDG